MNKYLRFATTSVLAGSLSLVSVGSAFADTESISNTGPSSTNVITENNSNSFSETNANQVTVNNSNSQTARTGNANVSGNTNAGSATSGDATNNATTTTRVAVAGSNGSVGAVGGSGGGTGGSGSGSGSGGTVNGAGGLGGGSVLGATGVGGRGAGVSGAGEATLPVTGPASPIDVSALRSLYGHSSVIPPAVVKQSNQISVAFLLGAAALSLIGAIGSAVYANRRERQL